MNATIYYSNGVTYEGNVANAPTRDVQVIVQPCLGVGWATQHTCDYYVWRNDLDEWRGTDLFGLWDYLARDGWKKVLFGRTILTEEYNAIYKRAKVDRDERKTGYAARERQPELI